MGLLRRWLCWKQQKRGCQMETWVEPLHVVFDLYSSVVFFCLQPFASHNMKAYYIWLLCHLMQCSVSSETKQYAEEMFIYVTNECAFSTPVYLKTWAGQMLIHRWKEENGWINCIEGKWMSAGLVLARFNGATRSTGRSCDIWVDVVACGCAPQARGCTKGCFFKSHFCIFAWMPWETHVGLSPKKTKRTLFGLFDCC